MSYSTIAETVLCDQCSDYIDKYTDLYEVVYDDKVYFFCDESCLAEFNDERISQGFPPID